MGGFHHVYYIIVLYYNIMHTMINPRQEYTLIHADYSFKCYYYHLRSLAGMQDRDSFLVVMTKVFLVDHTQSLA